jgi:hypothetical protein
MVYDAASDKYRPIDWDDAFALMARHLKPCPIPNQATFYTSGRTSNEAAFLFQLFVRMYGTNNFPDCSNMCHEPTSRGLPGTVGIGKGTVTLGFRACRHAADLRPEPGHQPPAHDERTARCGAARRHHRLDQSAARARAGALHQPAHALEMLTGSSTRSAACSSSPSWPATSR